MNIFGLMYRSKARFYRYRVTYYTHMPKWRVMYADIQFYLVIYDIYNRFFDKNTYKSHI